MAHIKQRLSQYAAVWLIGFFLSGLAILLGMTQMDLMEAADLVLPLMLGLVTLALAVGLVASWVSRETLGTKLGVTFLAVLLVLPLLWAPVSSAVLIAFLADRSIEYSDAYAAFQIGVARVLFPISQWFADGDLFGVVWQAFQVISTIVGFLSAIVKLWPAIKRLLGPEPSRA